DRKKYDGTHHCTRKFKKIGDDMLIASCGSVESNDCLITVKPYDSIQIEIESIVLNQFGEQIEKVIRDTLKDLKIDKLFVRIDDKGALDYTVKARLITAIKRLEESHA
ncbi:MAG: citrate lyase acyl carrier protein, partial [Acholeplasmataceae bacterium]|nr:citrate lyase acyl carrier protein [Acholeplasmataceae bacterium]